MEQLLGSGKVAAEKRRAETQRDKPVFAYQRIGQSGWNNGDLCMTILLCPLYDAHKTGPERQKSSQVGLGRIDRIDSWVALWEDHKEFVIAQHASSILKSTT